MATKFYVVWAGHKTGIFTDWPTCKRQVDGFSGARFKGFPTLAEAEKALGRSASTSASTTTPNEASPTRKRATKAAKVAKVAISSAMPIQAGVMIFCDGACTGNPGPAGSGLAVYRENALSEVWFGQYQQRGTNNTAELHALRHALLMAKDEIAKGHAVTIYADSQYAIKSMTTWGAKWKRDKWLDEGKPRKNVDILEPMYELYLTLKGKVGIEHVKGHAGVEGNEIADRMSVLAVLEQQEDLRLYREALDVAEILQIQ